MQFQTEKNSSSDFLRKKQAIHAALRTILSPEEAAIALASWEEYVNPSTSVFSGLNQFARMICEFFGKHGRHTELVQAMIRALMDGGVSHAEEEVAIQTRPEKSLVDGLDSNGFENRTSEFSSFQVLLLAILQEIDVHDAGKSESCRHFLLNAVDNLPWSPEQQMQVVSLINTGAAIQIRPYRAGQLVSLMHHLSVWMKDMLGADIAAKILRDAIGRAEQSAACMVYPPAEFING